MRTTHEEKAAFTRRLLIAMRRWPEPLKGATALSCAFNARYRRDRPVSPQTAHKWLSGRTVPNQDKLEVLAQMFDADVHWLHYVPSPGEEPLRTPARHPANGPDEVIALAGRIFLLDEHSRLLIEQLVEQFHSLESGG
jgi:hypothetical protein